jgi:hypothetical protein
MSETIDFVGLIENNPLTRLTGNYQSMMIDKIKVNFTTYEQQMFISSFYCYLNCDPVKDFIIDLDNVWKWLGFVQKVNAKRVLEKNFKLNNDYKISLCQLAKQDEKLHGGQNKEIIMLNIDTFKKFCLKSQTKKADEIHEYYIKMEKVLQDVLLEECNILTDQIKKIKQDNANKDTLLVNKEADYQIKLKKQRELEKEKILLNQFTMYIPIVYIIRVKTFENGEYIVKIGESRRGVVGRYNEHKNKYPECLLLDVFVVQQSKDFESYIHNHNKIRPNQVRDLDKHENETELFLVGKNLTYQIILDTINSQIDNYQEYGTKKIELEIEKLKVIATNNNSPVIAELLESNKRMEESNKLLHVRIDKLESLIEKLIEAKPPRTGFQEILPTLGPRVQKINPDTLKLIKVYESATEVMNEDRTIKRPSLSKAVLENTVYNGFRWLFVERDMDSTVIHNLQPTRQTVAKNMDYVAKLNKDQTEIINVYLDRKTAALMNGYSMSGLDNAVKKGIQTQGFYYKLYSNCDKEIIQKFTEKYGKNILLYKDGIGMYNESGKLVKEYKCKYECIKLEKISDKTLAKAMAEDKAYNGYKFRMLPSRLSC